MEEIQIYKDKALKNPIEDKIQFDKVMAGKTTTKKIYVQNKIKYKLNINLSLEGENISLVEEIKEIFPEEVKEVLFELKPTITMMKPITAKLKIKLNYVVG